MSKSDELGGALNSIGDGASFLIAVDYYRCRSYSGMIGTASAGCGPITGACPEEIDRWQLCHKYQKSLN